jgi:hypothetical protein
LSETPVTKAAVIWSLILCLSTASRWPSWFTLNLPVVSELNLWATPSLASTALVAQLRANSLPTV